MCWYHYQKLNNSWLYKCIFYAKCISVFLNIRFSHDLYLLPSSNYRSQFNNKTWPIWEVFFLCRLCILLKCTFDYSVFFATWCVNNWRKLLGLKVSTCRQKVSNLGTVISLKALRHEWILRTIIGCTKKISFIKMALIIFFTFIYIVEYKSIEWCKK